MSAFAFVRLVHVLWAVLGLGLIAAMALLARTQRTTAASELLVLSRWSSIGLFAMLGTGIAMNVLSNRSFEDRWWFRLSALSLLVTGVVLGLARRRLRQWVSGELEASRARRQVQGSAWAACALVAWITVLMELRPF